MSHEIRTPLNGILGLSCLMEEESIPDELRPMMGLIRTSGEVLRRVLDDVLDFSKVDSGKLELVEEPFDLAECLRWSFELFRDAAQEKNLAYRLTLDQRLPPWVLSDAARLRQITANLMSNAVKFTHTGSIDLEAHLVEWAPPEGRHLIRVVVRDTGIGIPQDRIGRLFQPFTQVDAATNRSYGGTGLGLAISDRLIEMLGGTIHVESQPGVGTAFEFTFTAGVAEGIKTGGAVFKVRDLTGVRVLVVEDNKINQKVASRILEKMGCQVDVATDGASAIRSVEANSYDVLLMDLSMPGIDGMETTRRIRTMPGAKASVPIVALTASASPEIRAECLAAGMNDFLGKPMELEAVRSAVDRWRRAAPAPESPAVSSSA